MTCHVPEQPFTGAQPRNAMQESEMKLNITRLTFNQKSHEVQETDCFEREPYYFESNSCSPNISALPLTDEGQKLEITNWALNKQNTLNHIVSALQAKSSLIIVHIISLLLCEFVACLHQVLGASLWSLIIILHEGNNKTPRRRHFICTYMRLMFSLCLTDFFSPNAGIITFRRRGDPGLLFLISLFFFTSCRFSAFLCLSSFWKEFRGSRVPLASARSSMERLKSHTLAPNNNLQ